MLKLVNRTRSPGSRFTFCADLRDVASRIPPPLVLRIFSLFLLRSSLPRKPLRPRLRSSDNGGLALSSWFIASFDCQVHAGESDRPPSSRMCPTRFLSYASSPALRPSHSVLSVRRRYVSLMKLTVTMCARDRSLDHSHARDRSLSFPIFYSNNEYLEFAKYAINLDVSLGIFPRGLPYEYLRKDSYVNVTSEYVEIRLNLWYPSPHRQIIFLNCDVS